MKLPGWAMAVGGIMMLLGGCGALNNIQKVYAPKVFDESSEVMNEISRAMEEDMVKEKAAIVDTLEDGTVVVDSSELRQIEMAEDIMSDALNISDYYKKWMFRFGIIGTIVAAIYFLAGLLMIIGKPFSLKAVYFAICLSLVSVISQIIVFSMDDNSGWLTMFGNLGSYFVIFMNIVLLVVVLASDKTYFYQEEMVDV